MNKNRQYLGNHIYIERYEDTVRLCINRKEGKAADENIMYMTPEVISNLLLYLEKYDA